MVDLPDEFNFVLSRPIQVHVSGDLQDLSQLTIKAPSNKNQKYLIKLRQGLNQALQDVAKPTKEDVERARADVANAAPSDDAFKAEAYIQLLFSSNIDMVQYCANFKDLLLQTCTVGSGVPLTSSLYDQMLVADTEALLGEYLKTFLSLSKINV